MAPLRHDGHVNVPSIRLTFRAAAARARTGDAFFFGDDVMRHVSEEISALAGVGAVDPDLQPAAGISRGRSFHAQRRSTRVGFIGDVFMRLKVENEDALTLSA